MGMRLDQRNLMAARAGANPTVSPPRASFHGMNHLLGNHLASGLLLACFALVIIAILLGFIPSLTLLTALLSLAAGAFGFLRVGKNTDALNPVRVFGTIWCLCLALASLRLTTTMTDWPATVWGYLIMALLAFIGGFWLTSRRTVRGHHPQGRGSESELPPSEMLDPRRSLRWSFLCLLVGISAFSYEYWLIGGIPVLAQNIDDARTIFFATAGQWSHPEFDTLFYKIVGILTIPCKYAVYLAIILLIKKTKKTKAQIVMATAIIICGVLALASQGGRSLVFDVLIFSALLFHYLRRRLRVKHLFVGGIVLFLFLSAAGYFRIAIGRPEAVHSEVERVSRLPRGPVWDNMIMGYEALTGPLEGFAQFSRDFPLLGHPSEGFLFYSFHRFVPRANIEEYLLYGNFGIVTNTFLGEFYGDFGVLGIIFGPFILGLGYGYVYSRALGYKSLYWFLVLAVIVGILVYFPYLNFFSQQLTWIIDLSALAILISLAKAGKRERLPSFFPARGRSSPVATLSRPHVHN